MCMPIIHMWKVIAHKVSFKIVYYLGHCAYLSPDKLLFLDYFFTLYHIILYYILLIPGVTKCSSIVACVPMWKYGSVYLCVYNYVHVCLCKTCPQVMSLGPKKLLIFLDILIIPHVTKCWALSVGMIYNM